MFPRTPSLVLRTFTLFGYVVPLLGCSVAHRRLYSVTGNEFTLFPASKEAPQAISCSGPTSARFDCFARRFEARAHEHQVAGALGVVTADGVRTAVHTDDLNRSELEVSEDTRFPIGSVTKMFLAAAAVALSQDGLLDLHEPTADYVPGWKVDSPGRRERGGGNAISLTVRRPRSSRSAICRRTSSTISVNVACSA